MRNIKCVVACTNTNGEPDLYPVIISCPERGIEDGDHYVAACRRAGKNGFAPHLCYDEDGFSGATLVELFNWSTVRTEQICSLDQARLVLDRARKICDEEKSWSKIHGLVFGASVAVRFAELCPDFTYASPDTSYEEDVKAWMRSAEAYLGEKAKLIEGAASGHEAAPDEQGEDEAAPSASPPEDPVESVLMRIPREDLIAMLKESVWSTAGAKDAYGGKSGFSLDVQENTAVRDIMYRDEPLYRTQSEAIVAHWDRHYNSGEKVHVTPL